MSASLNNKFIDMIHNSVQLSMNQSYYNEMVEVFNTAKEDDTFYSIIINFGIHLRSKNFTKILDNISNEIVVEIKIDNNEPMKLNGLLYRQNYFIMIPLLKYDDISERNNKLLISQMKSGKQISIFLNEMYLIKDDLDNFSDSFEKIVPLPLQEKNK